MSKPKEEFGQRNKFIRFRVSEEMYEMVADEAQKCGLSLSDYCRNALLNHPTTKLPIIIHDESAILQELRNINKLGGNLNQIARHLNQGGAATAPLIEEIKKELSLLDNYISNFNRAVEKEYGRS